MRRKPHSCLSRFVRSANSRRKPVRKFTAHVSVKMRGGSRNGMLERARLVAAPVLGLVSQGLQRVIEPFKGACRGSKTQCNRRPERAATTRPKLGRWASRPAVRGRSHQQAACFGACESTRQQSGRWSGWPAAWGHWQHQVACFGACKSTRQQSGRWARRFLVDRWQPEKRRYRAGFAVASRGLTPVRQSTNRPQACVNCIKVEGVGSLQLLYGRRPYLYGRVVRLFRQSVRASAHAGPKPERRKSLRFPPNSRRKPCIHQSQ